MKKKIALLVACLFLMTSAALAAPLTDYSKGKASIDLNYRSTKNTAEDVGLPGFGRRSNFEPTVTYGVADKWAIQWRNVSSKSKSVSLFPGVGITSTLTVNELNALYSLTPEISAFVGYVSAKGTLDDGGAMGFGKLSGNRNTLQLGLLASVPIVEKVSLYGVAGVGDKWHNYEIGVSYAYNKNWEFNVDYRSLKVKGLSGDSVGFGVGDVTAKTNGWGFGATYKFK